MASAKVLAGLVLGKGEAGALSPMQHARMRYNQPTSPPSMNPLRTARTP